jgi:hypothetical protein
MCVSAAHLLLPAFYFVTRSQGIIVKRNFEL